MVVAIDSGTGKRSWPSREQWAKNQRSTYWDNETGCPFADDYSHQLSDYASAEEGAAAIEAVKVRLKTIRKLCREANKGLGPLGRQLGESKRAYHERLFNMTRSDRDRVIDSLGPDDQPFKKALKTLTDGFIPRYWNNSTEPPAPLGEIIQRYAAARQRAQEDWIAMIEATPIDDAAWEEELRRRKFIEETGGIVQRRSSV